MHSQEGLQLHASALKTLADSAVREKTHGYETVLLSKRLALWCGRDGNKLEIVCYSQTIRCQINIATRTGRNLD